MAEKGRDIFGNPIGTTVHGLTGDENAQGNRPKSVFGRVAHDIWGNATGSDTEQAQHNEDEEQNGW